MTSQEKKRFLQLYRHHDAEINRLLCEREMWMARATRMTTKLTGMPGGSRGRRGGTENIIFKIINIDRDIERQIDALVDTKTEIVAVLDTVADPTLRQLLELRYLDGKTFEQIAVDMHYGWRHVCKLHGRALDMIKMA